MTKQAQRAVEQPAHLPLPHTVDSGLLVLQRTDPSTSTYTVYVQPVAGAAAGTQVPAFATSPNAPVWFTGGISWQFDPVDEIEYALVLNFVLMPGIDEIEYEVVPPPWLALPWTPAGAPYPMQTCCVLLISGGAKYHFNVKLTTGTLDRTVDPIIIISPIPGDGDDDDDDDDGDEDDCNDDNGD